MRRLTCVRLAILGALSILLAGTMAAYATANTVPQTRMDLDTVAINANALKPSACSALNLANIVTGSGTLNGSGVNDLILASAGVDTLNGAGGTDCLVAGSGNDTLSGGAGADILLGGDGDDNLLGNGGVDTLYGEGGNDSLYGGAGNDTCDGGSGTDTATNCETSVNIP
jgi:Ca2+-binding RTX toxin-like protein